MKWRRWNYLIDKDFQFRYIGRIVFSILVMVLITAFTVYYTTWEKIMDQFYNLPQIAARFSPLFTSVNQSLAIFLLVFLVLIAGVSVFISHTIAGPVFHLARSMKALTAGDLTLKIDLRKGDEFKYLAETMNEMIVTIRNRLLSQRDAIILLAEVNQSLQASGKNLKTLPKSMAVDLRKLNILLNRLEKSTGEFNLQ